MEKLMFLRGVAWYLTALCNTLGISLKDVLDKNVEKLRSRYPDGLSAERSKNRESSENA